MKTFRPLLSAGVALGIILTSMGSSLSARGDAPLAVPSPVAPVAQVLMTSEQLLALPAHDVEVFSAAEPVRVGDTVILKVPGVDPRAVIQFQAAAPNTADATAASASPTPASEDSLEDQGWALSKITEPDKDQRELRFQAVPLKAGALSLPSLAILDADGKPVARTNPFSFQATSSIKSGDAKPTEPAPLQPPVRLAFPWWIAVVAGLFLIGLIAAAVYAYRRYRKSIKPLEKPVPIQPQLPEDEEALAALAVLETNGPMKRGQFKAHYFGLSEILKNYIGRRYRFDAPESTSREIIHILDERKNVGEGIVDRIEALFDRLDLVKFTDHVPLPTEGLDLLKEAREIIVSTRRVPAPATILPESALQPKAKKERP